MVDLDRLEEHLNEIIQDGRGEECYTKAKNVMVLVRLIRENQKDAERYRWLRDKASIENHGGFEYDLPLIHAIRYMEGPELNQEMTFDEAIDQAMKENEDE